MSSHHVLRVVLGQEVCVVSVRCQALVSVKLATKGQTIPGDTLEIGHGARANWFERMTFAASVDGKKSTRSHAKPCFVHGMPVHLRIQHQESPHLITAPVRPDFRLVGAHSGGNIHQ